MVYVSYGFRVLASPRHATVVSISRFRGAGRGVRGAGRCAAEAARFFYGANSNMVLLIMNLNVQLFILIWLISPASYALIRMNSFQVIKVSFIVPHIAMNR